MKSFTYLLMKSFTYTHPVKILSGENTYLKLPSIINTCYKSVLFICTDETFFNNHIFEKIKSNLIELGVLICEITNITYTLKLSAIQLGIQKCIDNNVDCIIALGDTSTIDAAKLIGMAARSVRDPYEYKWESKLSCLDSIPVITIPTLSGAGSEMNDYAVIVNDETREKYYYKCHLPVLTVMDPALTANVPIELSVYDSISMLNKIFECYFNYCIDDLQKCCLEHLILGIMKATQNIIKNPNNLTIREELIWCAAIATDVLSQISPTDKYISCHHLAESISNYFDIDYGACLGVITPRFLQKTFQIKPVSFARFARNVFSSDFSDDTMAAQLGIDLYVDWLKKVGAPNTYSDISNQPFDEISIEHAANNMWKTYKNQIGTSTELTYEDILEILMNGKQKIKTLSAYH